MKANAMIRNANPWNTMLGIQPPTTIPSPGDVVLGIEIHVVKDSSFIDWKDRLRGT